MQREVYKHQHCKKAFNRISKLQAHFKAGQNWNNTKDSAPIRNKGGEDGRGKESEETRIGLDKIARPVLDR